MKKEEVLRKIRKIRLMPLFYNADPEIATEVMKAVFEGGITLMEFTNRGSNALLVFQKLVEQKTRLYPEALLGIGSVVDASTAVEYIQAGADFVVFLVFGRILRICVNQKRCTHGKNEKSCKKLQKMNKNAHFLSKNEQK